MEVANENYEIILNAGLSLTMVQVSCEVPTGSFCIGGKCNREEPLDMPWCPAPHCTNDAHCRKCQCTKECHACIKQCFNHYCVLTCVKNPLPPPNV